jgi:glutathione synthase/RimK-type ligase-like ATP-grasp enzyme
VSTPAPRRVLLATCSELPDGEEWAGTSLLPAAFADRQIDASWVVWDDQSVDWSSGLVAVRSTWDYETRREEFLDWARAVPWMLNSAAVFTWNTDKSYLAELASEGVPVVPTVVVRHRDELAGAVAEVSGDPERLSAVVKPTVGAGGRGVVVLDGPNDLVGSGHDCGFGPGPWVVQPLVAAVRTEGETSVFVFDGEVVSQAQKRPAAGEIRVHEAYGGTTVAVPVSGEAAELARRTVEAAAVLLGEGLDYARVDQMRLADGTLAVSELEVTEPGLYLEILPQNADAFAELVQDRLHHR